MATGWVSPTPVHPAIGSSMDMDCGPRCRSQQHAAQLISAITKGSVHQIISFLSRCHNADNLCDSYGRTVLHLAASCGKPHVLQWLTTDRNCSLTAQDRESGWTALHRALFYGQLTSARLLSQIGCKLTTRDREGLTPLDIVMKDRLPHVEFVHSGLSEVYTWGTNSNFTLGHENMQRRKSPEQIEFFRKNGIYIKMVAMSTYHSIFLSNSGQVFTCGHGLGGRLGHGDEQTCLVPKLIEAIKGETCVQVSASVNNTLFLMESGAIFSCGMNTYHQLGLTPPPERSLVPKQVNSKILKGRKIQGVCCLQYHTVVHTKDNVFTFGLNAGQLGHMKVAGERLISQPRPVSALNHKDMQLHLVAASDAATVVVTSKGDVYVLHEYQCRKIITKFLDISQICVSGGHLDHNVDVDTLNEHGGSVLTVVLLTTTSKVFVWQESDHALRRCSWTIHRSLHITHLALGASCLVCVTRDGEGFIGTIPKSSQSSTLKILSPTKESSSSLFSLRLSDLVDRDDIIDVSLERLAQVHRATFVATDNKGINYSVLQANPNASITSVPNVASSEFQKHLLTLLQDSDTNDGIHDVVLEVGNTRVACHHFILASRSDYFSHLFCENADTSTDKTEKESFPPTPPSKLVHRVQLHGCSVAMFHQLLTFIYTDSCDVTTIGRSVQHLDTVALHSNPAKDCTAVDGHSKNAGKKSKKKQSQQNLISEKAAIFDPIGSLKTLAKEFGVKSLVKRLDCLHCVDGTIVKLPGKTLPYSQIYFERRNNVGKRLFDVAIESQDGRSINCHKCILVARLEYFQSMFSSSWIETSMTSSVKLPIDFDVLGIILNYLYTDDSPSLYDCEDLELLCSCLVVADQLLIGRLKNLCEVALSQMLTLRNACDLLEFSSIYNAEQLEATCQQFVCINLSALLETKSLASLSDDVMNDLTAYYIDNTPGMSRRTLTPYSDWPDVQTLESLDIFQERSSENLTGSGKKSNPKRRRPRTKSCDDNSDCLLSAGTEIDLMVGIGNRLGHLTKPENLIPEVEELNTTLEIFPMESSKSSEKSVDPRTSDQGFSSIPKQDLSLPKPIEDIVTKDVSRSSKPSMNTTEWDQVPKPSKEDVNRASQHLKDITAVEGNQAKKQLKDIMTEEEANRVADLQKTSSVPALTKPFKKLSQKDRKKIQHNSVSSESEVSSIPAMTDVNEPIAEKAINSNPWKSVGVVVQSMKDLMLSQTQDFTKQGLKSPSSVTSDLVIKQGGLTKCQSSVTADHVTKQGGLKSPSSTTSDRHLPSTSSNSGDIKLRWGSVQSAKQSHISQAPSFMEGTLLRIDPTINPTKEFPWKASSVDRDIASPVSPSTSFNEIIRDEMKQSEILQRTTNKSLGLVQAEERAIEELLNHYKAFNNVHEFITVERVSATSARPLWAATQRQTFF